MSILSLLDGLSVEEVGKLVLGERNQLIQNKMQEIFIKCNLSPSLDGLFHIA